MSLAIKSSMRDLCFDETVLYLDCQHPGHESYYCLLRCYHWGNWVKGTWDISLLFFTTSCEPTIFLNFLKFNFKMCLGIIEALTYFLNSFKIID